MNTKVCTTIEQSKKLLEFNMSTEDYVSWELATLLKKKGFPQDPNVCHTVYKPDGEFCNNAKSFWNPFAFAVLSKEYPMAPTYQMTLKWLRETCGLFVYIGLDDLDWKWQIFDIYTQDENHDPISMSESYGGVKTYEEAIKRAIKYCLEKIIE